MFERAGTLAHASSKGHTWPVEKKTSVALTLCRGFEFVSRHWKSYGLVVVNRV